MDDYGYVDPIEAKRINEEAAKMFLEHKKATESDIAQLLKSFVPKFNKLKAEFYTLPAGKIKLCKKDIAKEQQLLSQLSESMALETARYVAHSFYYTNFLNDVENQIDNLERDFRNGDLNKIIATLNLKNNKIQIRASENPDKIDMIMNGYKMEADKKAFVYDCLFKSFPKPYNNASRESKKYLKTTEVLAEYYLSRAEEVKNLTMKKNFLIYDLRGNLNKLRMEAQSENEKQNYAKYLEKFNSFKDEFYETAEYRIYLYLTKSCDSKMRSQIVKSLKKAQLAETEQKSEQQKLISPATLTKLLGDVSENLIDLNVNSNDKGRE